MIRQCKQKKKTHDMKELTVLHYFLNTRICFLLSVNVCVFCPSMLSEFNEEMDQTSSRMDSVLKKVEKVSHMTSSECIYSLLYAPLLVFSCF